MEEVHNTTMSEDTRTYTDNSPNVRDQHICENKWTIEICEIMRSYAFKSLGYCWIHLEDARFYYNINTVFNILILCLSAISAVGITGSIIFVKSNSFEKEIVIFYIISVFAIVLNVIVALLKALQFGINLDIRIATHAEKASKFGDLYRKIISQFALEANDRMDAINFMNQITERFNELEREKPFLRQRTIKKWDSHAQKIKENNLESELIKFPKEIMQYAGTYGIRNSVTNASLYRQADNGDVESQINETIQYKTKYIDLHDPKISGNLNLI